MRITTLIICAAVLAPGVALAQSSSGNSGSAGSKSSSDAAMSSQSASSQSGASQRSGAAQVRQSLQDAGFKNVKIVDQTYLIHAETKDGQPVVMYLDPPASGMAGSAGSNASKSGASSDQTKSTTSGSSSK